MKASEFDKKFDDGENILTELDLARARRPEEETKRINFDFPARMLASLDREAHRLGVTRQSLLSRCGWRNVCNNDSNPSILGGIIQKEPSYLKILLQHYNNLPSAAYIKYTGINFV